MIYTNEDDLYHRVNGPAVENTDGDYSWCYNGLMHRYYGPAWSWGGEYQQYFIFGNSVR